MSRIYKTHCYTCYKMLILGCCWTFCSQYMHETVQHETLVFCTLILLFLLHKNQQGLTGVTIHAEQSSTWMIFLKHSRNLWVNAGIVWSRTVHGVHYAEELCHVSLSLIIYRLHKRRGKYWVNILIESQPGL